MANSCGHLVIFTRVSTRMTREMGTVRCNGLRGVLIRASGFKEYSMGTGG